jgi:O-acetyl-ADP-ribose deacetylase (regulator of RNase III)
MKLIFGNLLDIDEGIILHQCNTQAIMGKGIASFLVNKYPKLKKATMQHVGMAHMLEQEVFGTVFLFPVSDNLSIGNCFSEVGMCSNRKPGDPANTSYDAVIKCFNYVKEFNTELREVYIPFKYGCGLAGGNWNIMLEILKDYDFTVVARNSDYEEWINNK